MCLWLGRVNHNIEIWGCEMVLLTVMSSYYFLVSLLLAFCFKWLNALLRGLGVHWKLKLRIIHNKWLFWDFLFALQQLSKKEGTVDHSSVSDPERYFLCQQKIELFLLHCWLCSKTLLPWNGNLVFQCMPRIFFDSYMLAWLPNPKLWFRCCLTVLLLDWCVVLCNMVNRQ